MGELNTLLRWRRWTKKRCYEKHREKCGTTNWAQYENCDLLEVATKFPALTRRFELFEGGRKFNHRAATISFVVIT